MDVTPIRVTVESLADHEYAGIQRPAGTVYEAEQPYAELLVTLGTVRLVSASRREPDARKVRRSPDV